MLAPSPLLPPRYGHLQQLRRRARGGASARRARLRVPLAATGRGRRRPRSLPARTPSRRSPTSALCRRSRAGSLSEPVVARRTQDPHPPGHRHRCGVLLPGHRGRPSRGRRRRVGGAQGAQRWRRVPLLGALRPHSRALCRSSCSSRRSWPCLTWRWRRAGRTRLWACALANPSPATAWRAAAAPRGSACATRRPPWTGCAGGRGRGGRLAGECAPASLSPLSPLTSLTCPPVP